MRGNDDFLWERQVWAYFLQAALAVQNLHHSHILHRWGPGQAGWARQAAKRGDCRQCTAADPAAAGPAAAAAEFPPFHTHGPPFLLIGRDKLTCLPACPPACPPLPCRDLKPQNLMLARGGALLKVADLGDSAELARVFTDTQVGGWVGGRAGGRAGSAGGQGLGTSVGVSWIVGLPAVDASNEAIVQQHAAVEVAGKHQSHHLHALHPAAGGHPPLHGT